MSTHDVDLPALPIGPGWLIAPRSYLVDRIVPDCERVWLPETATGGGTIRLTVGQHSFAPPAQGSLKGRLRRAARRDVPADADRPLIDLRAGYPENWAHFLNIHLALLALAAQTLDRAPTDFRLLMPAQTPGYVQKLAALVGLDCDYTDDEVSGQGVQISFDDWNIIRGARAELLTDPAISPVAAALADGRIPQARTPEKLFLSRKGTRALSNEDEIRALLEPQGFETVYMEEHSPAEQIRMLVNARQVVAVHGAALAPLFYRRPEGTALDLIELFPVGHLTNVYRAVAAAKGARWCGVRGHIASTNLREIYKLGAPYTKHSLEPFTIDPASLTLALTPERLPDLG